MISTKGFTLVELSIVIVIIGFLVAGIASASSMIEQAKIRSVISDIDAYKVAMNGFKAKYNAVPGDIPEGDAYFPTCATGGASCNGIGLGIITTNAVGPIVVAGAYQTQDEVRPALRELSLAGFINAAIPAFDNTTPAMVPGVNVPASKFVGVGYMFIDAAFMTVTTPTVGNALVIGKADNNSDGLLFNSAFTPLEAFSIDSKIDDGTVLADNSSIFDFITNNANASTSCTNNNNLIWAFQNTAQNDNLLDILIPNALADSSSSCTTGSDSGNFQYVVGRDGSGEANDLSITTPNVVGVVIVN